ncbi:MAG: peptide/nickel transport system permease protein [Candidatus Azotimanducaceae bacterium]|jgi:peptide/nickel transport system permease protein
MSSAVTAVPGKNIQDIGSLSSTRLTWIRFKRHRLAVASGIFLIAIYLIAAFCEFFAPYDPNWRNSKVIYGPPQEVNFVDSSGEFHLRPFVYGYTLHTNPDTWAREYEENTTKMFPLRFFSRGQDYQFWNLFETNIHFVTVADNHYLHFFGTDKIGRDLFSRVIYGARTSLSLGLIGVVLTMFFGIVIGGLAGYYGGRIDSIIQRSIEIIQSIPTLPLWMALSAALPPHWSPLGVYFGIIIILSFIQWTGLARVVRGRFLALREEDFVVAARLLGANQWRIIFKHLLPSFMSHIITTATLAIPSMILAETALSFLGVGLRAPIVSWGVLLQQAQNFQVIVLTPWLLIPGVFVVLVVIAFNLLGDGMRDAADPYDGGH